MVESDALFAVVDLETTGFSPLVGDRIVEIGIVRIAGDGSTVDEYATLINPLREVGYDAANFVNDTATMLLETLIKHRLSYNRIVNFGRHSGCI